MGADDEPLERMDLAALRQLHPHLETAYRLTQAFLQLLRKREGERLDTWLTQVSESQLPELQSFAHGVEQDKAAVPAGLTLPITHGQVEGQVTRVKLLKRMLDGKAGFALLRQRVLHRISRRLEDARGTHALQNPALTRPSVSAAPPMWPELPSSQMSPPR